MNKLINLASHFLKATERAAIASGKLRGCGDKNKADDAAVTAMRDVFETIPVHARVAIGEGEMDKAPMLYIGEELGQGLQDATLLRVDIAVDPLECTSHCAFDLPNSMCVLVVAPRGTLLHAPECYMDKIAGPPSLKGHISLNKSVEENINIASKILEKSISEIKVIILERPRNNDKINKLKELGVDIDFIQNGDIVGALRAVDGDADLLIGIGSAPEGVITAAAVRGLKGAFEGKLYFHEQSYKNKAEKVLGKNAYKVWDANDLCTSQDALFVATGVCDGWIPGVKYMKNKTKTWSKMIYVESGEMKTIETNHNK